MVATGNAVGSGRCLSARIFNLEGGIRMTEYIWNDYDSCFDNTHKKAKGRCSGPSQPSQPSSLLTHVVY